MRLGLWHNVAMSLNDIVSLIYAVSAVGFPVALAWGLNRIAQSVSRPCAAPSKSPAALPEPSKEEVDRFVRQLRKARSEKADAAALRGGMPDPATTRPGRHVNVPE